jgi:hypothetical protein
MDVLPKKLEKHASQKVFCILTNYKLQYFSYLLPNDQGTSLSPHLEIKNSISGISLINKFFQFTVELVEMCHFQNQGLL